MDNYAIIKELDQGAFSRVFLVTKDDNYYALKKIYKTIDNTSYMAQINNEITILTNLKNINNNIINIIEWFEDDEFVYVVFDYVPGGNLYQKILNKSEIEIILYQLVNVIGFIHNNGIIHGDIKPENILLYNEHNNNDNDNEHNNNINIVLIDFGLSKYENDPNNITKGTLKYIAPEFFKTGTRTKETDLWAIGMTYFYLLTGKYPFISDNPKFIKRLKHVSINYTSYNLTKKERKILKILLNKNPKKRQLSYVKKILNDKDIR